MDEFDRHVARIHRNYLMAKLANAVAVGMFVAVSVWVFLS
jgi:hypothetical protein